MHYAVSLPQIQCACSPVKMEPILSDVTLLLHNSATFCQESVSLSFPGGIVHGTDKFSALVIQTMLIDGVSDGTANFPSQLRGDRFFEENGSLSVLEIRGRNFVDRMFELLWNLGDNVVSNTFGGGGVDLKV
jgi:hypothetical protein